MKAPTFLEKFRSKRAAKIAASLGSTLLLLSGSSPPSVEAPIGQLRSAAERLEYDGLARAPIEASARIKTKGPEIAAYYFKGVTRRDKQLRKLANLAIDIPTLVGAYTSPYISNGQRQLQTYKLSRTKYASYTYVIAPRASAGLQDMLSGNQSGVTLTPVNRPVLANETFSIITDHTPIGTNAYERAINTTIVTAATELCQSLVAVEPVAVMPPATYLSLRRIGQEQTCNSFSQLIGSVNAGFTYEDYRNIAVHSGYDLGDVQFRPLVFSGSAFQAVTQARISSD